MPIDAPTWEDTTEDVPTWENTSDPVRPETEDDRLARFVNTQEQISGEPDTRLNRFTPINPSAEGSPEILRQAWEEANTPIGGTIPMIETSGKKWLPSIAAEAVNTASGIANFIRSPLGAATLPVAMLPGGPIVLGLAFGPGMAKEAGSNWGTAIVTGNKQLAARGTAQFGLAALMQKPGFTKVADRVVIERALAKAIEESPLKAAAPVPFTSLPGSMQSKLPSPEDILVEGRDAYLELLKKREGYKAETAAEEARYQESLAEISRQAELNRKAEASKPTEPPPMEGYRWVTIEKPDGSTYRAIYNDKTVDYSEHGLGVRASVAKPVTLPDGSQNWSHGITSQGERIIEPTKSTSAATGAEDVRLKRAEDAANSPEKFTAKNPGDGPDTATVTRDPQYPDSWRVSYFKNGEAFTHELFDSKSEAVKGVGDYDPFTDVESKGWSKSETARPAPPAATVATAPTDLISRLESLKFKGEEPGRLYSLPHPDAIKAIGRSAWNTGLDLAIAAVKAGKTIAEAVEVALGHFRKNERGFNEEKIRLNLASVLKDESPKAAESPKVVAAPESPAAPVATSTVSESAAKAMEKKVQLTPLEKGVGKVREQLDLFNQEIGQMLESGGQFLSKELRPDVAKGAPAESGTVTSAAVNQHFVNKLSTIRKQFNEAMAIAYREGTPEAKAYSQLLRQRFEIAFRQTQELRRASHESLYFWNKIKAEYQEIAKSAGMLPEGKVIKPLLDQIWKESREGNYADAAKHFTDYLRVNLFTLGSWTLDFGTNLAAVASNVPGWAVMDAAHFVSGKPAQRMATLLRSLSSNARNWNPVGKRFRLTDEIEQGLGHTTGGEFLSKGKEVMADFSEILRSKPELADKLRHADLLLAAPVRMKRATDNFFGRLGATADLYNSAYTKGKKAGLKGDELKQFVEEFVSQPDEAATASAVRIGKEIKFNRDLPLWQERIASSLGVKLFAEAFPRWTFQFVHWAGEMIGADPKFFRDVANGRATAEQTVQYLSKAATGWGSIYAFNKLFYENIDANTMEYVDENGERTRLSGRTPAPELYFITALLRGDIENAKAAMPYLSLPGAKLISGEPGGLLSQFIDTIRESWRGRYTSEMTTRELTKLVNDMLPGKSTLGFIRSFFDPTIREGVGSSVPGYSTTLPQRPNPTTGEPLAPRQRIPGTGITMPTVGGTPFPGAVRVLNDIEKTLMNHGLAVTRPRRTSIIELPAEDVPKELRREYEQRAGQNVRQIVGEGIKLKEFKELPMTERREVLKEWLADARALARLDISEKYGTSMKAVKSEELNLKRLPQRLRQ